MDGFAAAETLRQENPTAYNILSHVNVHAHASGNDGISIMPYRGFPVLNHDPKTGALLQIRWNTPDRASIDMPIEDIGIWYDAARHFNDILTRKDMEMWRKLEPGNVLIFDNWRVLHGRAAFTGKRRICGAYLNRDDWISRFKMLELGQETVLGSLKTGRDFERECGTERVGE